MSARCRILAIMGSGETSPTMVTVHKMLAGRLGMVSPDAVLLDAPYAFQENAADVSARAQSYFANSVGLAVAVLASADGGDYGARVSTADWVFAGPGSPSYALSKWRASPVGAALRDRVSSGAGVTVLASAAAATAGLVAIPVYEIYKAGAEPSWLEGLDLLGVIGLRVAVIPHYDNAEGGTHDTRYCYLGERRLAEMERSLPAGTAVLGVDEHTALVFDLIAETAEICGRGNVTVRRDGVSLVLPAPAVLSMTQLRDAVRTGLSAPLTAAPVPGPREPAAAPPLTEVVTTAERRFDEALAAGDGTRMIMSILDLEYAIHDWAGDTEEDQGTNQARAVLRGLIARLGDIVTEGLRDPDEKLRPAVGLLLDLRSALRADGRYAEADAIRAALTAGGVQISDVARGTTWSAAAPGLRKPPGDPQPDQPA
jgi:hypothetical protein